MSLARNLSKLAAFLSSAGQTQTAGIADGAITTAKIADGAVVTVDIANNAVTPAKMANAGAEFGIRNRIINGAMMIDQRNAGASVTSNNSGQYPVDRFIVESYGGGVLTSQQSTTVPAGFKNSTLITVTTTDTSLAATDDYEISQKIEGFNVADLGWGAAGAATITLSFWVRSSVTGSYSVGFQNVDASRSYVGTYTINSANTWEQKTITVTGDTSGTWNTGNSTGLFLRWCLATGSNRVASAASTWESANRIAVSATANPIMGTSGATFYITGVQLEKGSTATPFDFRSYGQELALCQRYYCKLSGANGRLGLGYNATTTEGTAFINFPVPMRTGPTALETSGTAADYGVQVLGSTGTCSAAPTFQGASTIYSTSINYFQAGLVAGQGGMLSMKNSSTAFLGFSAEL